MSTRLGTLDSEIRQERWSSSTELRSDFLLGNLVAKRCSVLSDPIKRKACWFIQDISMRQGLRSHPSCNQFPSRLPFDERNTSEGLGMLADEILWRSGQFGEIEDAWRRKIKAWLTELCLNPDVEIFNQKPLGNIDAIGILSSIISDCSVAPLARVAETATKTALFDLLDYCLSCRGLVMAEGTYRVGKSYSAQAWAQCHSGEARYVQLSSVNDDESFFRQIAKSIGVACSLTRKASEIRERVEITLQEQQLALVIDEAAFVLPQATRTRHIPKRLCWIVTALVNRGVPVALVASRDFSRIMHHMERHLPIFGQEQFWGRLRLRISLPDKLEETDLVEISRVLAPEADDATLLLLAGMAMRHTGYIATVESVVSRARFNALRRGRQFSFHDAQVAMSEIDPTFKITKCEPIAQPPRHRRAASLSPIATISG